eukprot:TRINITY_DN15202_c0_g1_i3.p1 TRINITY_DN15202_c0_g1~~TRINITY_DN15202_c0_g1_i3.p1  ORF type:complete len:708 (+),score=134.10 TRINITY_DN15202_c0_g1_i3:223-2346(+)
MQDGLTLPSSSTAAPYQLFDIIGGAAATTAAATPPLPLPDNSLFNFTAQAQVPSSSLSSQEALLMPQSSAVGPVGPVAAVAALPLLHQEYSPTPPAPAAASNHHNNFSSNSVDLLLQFSDLANNLRDSPFVAVGNQNDDLASGTGYAFTHTIPSDQFQPQEYGPTPMFPYEHQQHDASGRRNLTTDDTNRTDSYDFDIYRSNIVGDNAIGASMNVESGDHQRPYHQAQTLIERRPIAGKGIPRMSPKSSSRSHDIISVYSSYDEHIDEDELELNPDGVDVTDSESLLQNEPGNLLDKIRFSDIKLGKKIGDGTFGEVYEASLWSQPVAVKIMRIKSEESNKANSQLRKFQKEVNIMKTLRHPNIVEYMGISFPSERGSSSSDMPVPQETGPRMCIVTELLPNGNLEQLLSKRKLSWKRYFRFAKDIASGLNWLHHKGIIHRDLKPSNLLVTSSYHIKIADFGLSHMKNNPAGSMGVYSVCGTRCYIAPEVLQKKPYDTKADVFSYGVVLCEMVNGNYPFETMDSRETYSLNEMIVSGMRPRMPEECPMNLRLLIERCWDDNAQNRPSMEEILEMLDKFEKESLAASQVFLDEELDVLPEELRKSVNEDKLRLSEIQAELYTMRSRYAALNGELESSHAHLKNEITTKRKLEKRVKTVSQQRDRWKADFEALERKLVEAQHQADLGIQQSPNSDHASISYVLILMCMA